jgi:transposase
MDNLGAHKNSAVRRAIRAAGARLLFLPPYSPDLNPIEQVFAKLKTRLRKTEERTVDGLWRRLGGLLDAFPSPRMRQLAPKRRICFDLNLNRSSIASARPSSKEARNSLMSENTLRPFLSLTSQSAHARSS